MACLMMLGWITLIIGFVALGFAHAAAYKQQDDDY